MANNKDPLSDKEVKDMLDTAPEVVQAFKERNRPIKVEELFQGEGQSVIDSIKNKGSAMMSDINGRASNVSAMVDKEGYVYSLATTVGRRPGKSMDFVRDIEDFQDDTEDRQQKVQMWWRIYETEGIINNSVNKTSSLVSSEGNFYVRRARQGNRKITNVEEELQVLLDYWKRHVNSRTEGGPITSARGLAAIVDQGTRQSLVEGSYVGYMNDINVTVPSLGGSYTLPMYIQSISTEFLEIPDILVGTGFEQFLWEPSSEVQDIILADEVDDDRLREIINRAFPPEIASELEEHGNIMLDPERVIHVKHRGVDTEPFGSSFIQPAISDLAYKRALQALDFVTIESIVNRVLIVKVGSDDPESDYHNLEFAQKRLLALRRLFSSVDPTMTVLWAGPDIDVVDVGVHGKLEQLDGRYEIAHERILYALGTPEALLTGKASGQVWPGYEGYRESLRAIQNSWQQSMVSVGERIAELNGFEGVEISFEFDRTLLADQNANANLALRAHRQGISSIRATVSALGKDFETEKRNRILELGLDPEGGNVPPDAQIFAPPLGMPGDTRVDDEGNVVDPGGDPGRPDDAERGTVEPRTDGGGGEE
jgi:hypothetical protein